MIRWRARLIAAMVVTAVALAGCGSLSDSQVSSDLASLIGQKSNLQILIPPSQILCAHQSGNSYSCALTWNGQQFVVSVTDDGNAISEVGFDPQAAASSSGG